MIKNFAGKWNILKINFTILIINHRFKTINKKKRKKRRKTHVKIINNNNKIAKISEVQINIISLLLLNRTATHYKIYFLKYLTPLSVDAD